MGTPEDTPLSKPAPEISVEQELQRLARELPLCLLRDRRALGERLRRLRRRYGSGRPVDRGLGELRQRIERSTAQLRRRAEGLPQPSYPPDLPVSEYRDHIADAIERNQVTVVCGETGSGKTTQIPKICLSLGRGVAGMIGHTQPRRIAARNVAARIAQELGSELGGLVGYKVRFGDRVGPSSYVKVMTDGILLAETQGDRDMEAYDTLIIDEAHERSLNIDFLLGYLKALLPRRPDLKLIITSATIDPDRFSRHFDDAPIVQVPGRTYPVTVHYRPLVSEDEDLRERDLQQAILDGVDEVSRLGRGDILVFLAGEREIRETAEALRKHHPAHTEILPLYARLSASEQQRVFRPMRGRRIVLATNVAETSLTVPGIRYVIDPGRARISRYSYRTKVQRLPVEPVSQASANQRKGRCGRVSAGVCIRLYSEEDFAGRSEFTEPEIQRTNLAAVILQMAALGLGEIERFPFIDPPDRRYVNDGYQLLLELGAMDGQRRLTATGRELARLPVDPRLGRMILEARQEGCLAEVLVIVSALSVQDPRERPLEAREKADEAHRQFQDQRSDFLGFLKLWDFYHENARHLSTNKLRRLCRDSFLSYVRMREWHDIHQQLLGLLHDTGLRANEAPAEYAAIHRALLSGLLGNLGFRAEEQDYTGARNIRFRIFPGSTLVKARPKWIVAAELVETGRLYGRTVARMDPDWVESLAGELVRRSYAEPRWERRRAQVAATEKVTLYGLPVVSGRKVNYGPIDPVASREIFIRHALVEGEYATDAPFSVHNRVLVTEIQDLEHKSRCHDILADEQAIYDFYDARIPAEVHSGAGFEKWWRRAETSEPRLLFLTRDVLMRHSAAGVTGERFPERLEIDGMSLSLSYRFEPGHEEDGVTVEVPLAVLNTLEAGRFEWLVPGLLKDKLTALIKTLPKSLRRNFVPAPDFAQACLEAMTPGQGALLAALSRQLTRMTGVQIAAETWQTEALPAHLRMRFAVLDQDGSVMAAGRDLEALQRALSQRAAASFRPAPSLGLERRQLRAWDFGDLPEQVSFEQDGLPLQGYPALVDETDSVAIRIFDTREIAREAHAEGLRRLFVLVLSGQFRSLEKGLPGIRNMCLSYTRLPGPPWGAGEGRRDGACEALRRDLVLAIAQRVFLEEGGDLRTAAAFEARKERGRPGLVEAGDEVCRLVANVLAEHYAIQGSLSRAVSGAREKVHADIRRQLDYLVYLGFVRQTPYRWLSRLPSYLKAIRRRLDRLQHNPAQDARKAAEIAPLWQAYLERAEGLDGVGRRELGEFHWLLEEFRVSLFAQELRTLLPVSQTRLEKRWRELNLAQKGR